MAKKQYFRKRFWEGVGAGKRGTARVRDLGPFKLAERISSRRFEGPKTGPWASEKKQVGQMGQVGHGSSSSAMATRMQVQWEKGGPRR